MPEHTKTYFIRAKDKLVKVKAKTPTRALEAYLRKQGIQYKVYTAISVCLYLIY